MSYGWLVSCVAAVDVVIWFFARAWFAHEKAKAFATGLIMGRAASEVDQESLDRFLREAGIDPTTLP